MAQLTIKILKIFEWNSEKIIKPAAMHNGQSNGLKTNDLWASCVWLSLRSIVTCLTVLHQSQYSFPQSNATTKLLFKDRILWQLAISPIRNKFYLEFPCVSQVKLAKPKPALTVWFFILSNDITPCMLVQTKRYQRIASMAGQLRIPLCWKQNLTLKHFLLERIYYIERHLPLGSFHKNS